MTARGAPSRALALTVVWFAACNGQFRFDDHSRDAGADAADGARADVPCDSAAACGFVPLRCLHDGCPFECPSRDVCAGRCGASCSADCESQSTCTLEAATGARLRCEERSRCDFMVGADSTLACWSGSRCDVRCRGRCTLDCADTATCTLACNDQPPRPVTGNTACP